MKKVLVIGCGGAGKTTFAIQLGKILGIEVIHLDSYYWHPGWVETSKNEWLDVVEGLVSGPSWIVDGNYSGTLEIRLQACDSIIFLDISRMTCLWRVVKRSVKFRNKRRPDMAEGCHEKLSLDFLFWIWSYRKGTRPQIVDLLKANSHTKRVVWLRSKKETDEFSGLKRRIET